MKDRLIELLEKADETIMGFTIDGDLERLADHLLANGVVVPPCEYGTHVWKITYPYGQEPRVTEFVLKQTVGERHEIQIEIQAVDVPAKSWMCYATFYLTKAEAEKALAERSGNESVSCSR